MGPASCAGRSPWQRSRGPGLPPIPTRDARPGLPLAASLLLPPSSGCDWLSAVAGAPALPAAGDDSAGNCYGTRGPGMRMLGVLPWQPSIRPSLELPVVLAAEILFQRRGLSAMLFSPSFFFLSLLGGSKYILFWSLIQTYALERK